MAKTQQFSQWYQKWVGLESMTIGNQWSYLDLVSGWTDRGTSTLLNQAVSVFLDEGEQYLEVGTYCGKSVCAALAKNEVSAQIIEPFGLVLPDGDAIEAAWRRNTKTHGVFDRITLHKSTSQSFSGGLPPIGVYYYDGSHEVGDTYHGLTSFEHLLEDRAIIIADDYSMPEVRPDVDRYVAERDNVTLLGITPFKPYNQAVMILER
jgi:hypothetical protein